MNYCKKQRIRALWSNILVLITIFNFKVIYCIDINDLIEIEIKKNPSLEEKYVMGNVPNTKNVVTSEKPISNIEVGHKKESSTDIVGCSERPSSDIKDNIIKPSNIKYQNSRIELKRNESFSDNDSDTDIQLIFFVKKNL